MTFREDVYSLLYISLVKPQYKMYCDLVARTGDKKPFDLDHPVPSVLAVDSKLNHSIEEHASGCKNWPRRFASYVCCRRPEFDQNGEARFTSKALILDVISVPSVKK